MLNYNMIKLDISAGLKLDKINFNCCIEFGTQIKIEKPQYLSFNSSGKSERSILKSGLLQENTVH